MDLWGALAAAYPAGGLSLSHYDDDEEIANYIEVCTDPGDEGSEWNYMVDAIYYYKRARITINWAAMWNYIFSCAGANEDLIGRMLQNILAHEVAHTLGFQHQTDIIGNLMSADKSCQMLANQPFLGYRQYMLDTLNDYSLPIVAGETLELWWENLACYSPAGPP